MKRIVFRSALVLLPLLLILNGCAGFMRPEAYNPVTRSISVKDNYDTAYSKSIRSIASLGSEIISQDKNSGTISAKVHKAVLLNVIVSKNGNGATIDVIGSIMPEKIGFGSFTEVDDFITAYQSLK